MKICMPEDDTPPILVPPPPIVVQVISSAKLVSVFALGVEDALLRWSENSHFCTWRSEYLGKKLEISVVEGLWFEELVYRVLFILSDQDVVYSIFLPLRRTDTVDLNGRPLALDRAPVYGYLYA